MCCRKPFTDKPRKAAFAEEIGRLGEDVMEAFHHRYHARPLKKPAPEMSRRQHQRQAAEPPPTSAAQ